MRYICAIRFLFLSCPFFPQTFLELNRLNHWERWENTPSVCPPRSCRALLSLCSLLGVWSSEFGSICIWNAFYSHANKRIRFTGHSSCSCQTRRFLSHFAILVWNTFLSPRRQWERKAENRSLLFPCCFCLDWTEKAWNCDNDSVWETFINPEFILPGLLVSLEMTSFVFNDVLVLVR